MHGRNVARNAGSASGPRGFTRLGYRRSGADRRTLAKIPYRFPCLLRPIQAKVPEIMEEGLCREEAESPRVVS